MQSNNSARRKGDPWLGAAFLAAGALVIFLSGSIHAIGLGDNFDPGAKAFHIGLSILLILGGLVELLPGGKSASSATASKSDPKTKTVLFLLGAFLAYVIILPWLGFSITTLIMATAMMIRACQMNMLKTANSNTSGQWRRSTRKGTFIATKAKPKMGVPNHKHMALNVSGGKPVTPIFMTGQFKPHTKVSKNSKDH